jgi:hypothetical protein
MKYRDRSRLSSRRANTPSSIARRDNALHDGFGCVEEIKEDSGTNKNGTGSLTSADFIRFAIHRAE